MTIACRFVSEGTKDDDEVSISGNSFKSSDASALDSDDDANSTCASLPQFLKTDENTSDTTEIRLMMTGRPVRTPTRITTPTITRPLRRRRSRPCLKRPAFHPPGRFHQQRPVPLCLRVVTCPSDGFLLKRHGRVGSIAVCAGRD